jgi:hypothetical protein
MRFRLVGEVEGLLKRYAVRENLQRVCMAMLEV